MSGNLAMEIYTEYKRESISEYGIYRFEQNGKYGLVKMRRQGDKAWHCAPVSENAELITPAYWDEIRIKLYNDLDHDRLGCIFFVRNEEYWGVLDCEGHTLIETYLTQIETEVLDDKVDYCVDFHEGLTWDVDIADGDKKGFVICKGSLIPPIYDNIKHYRSKGHSISYIFDGYVVQKGKFWGGYNAYGQLIVPIIYDSVNFYSYDMGSGYNEFEVKKNGRFGLINGDDGTVILDTEWDSIDFHRLYFSWGDQEHRGDNYIVERNHKFGFYDQENKRMLIPPIWDEIKAQCSDAFMDPYGYNVRIGNKWGFIDRNGKQICEPIWDEIDLFCNGVARVRSGDVIAYMDTQGRILDSGEQLTEYPPKQKANIMPKNIYVLCPHTEKVESPNFQTTDILKYKGNIYPVGFDADDMLWFVERKGDSKQYSLVRSPEFAVFLGDAWLYHRYDYLEEEVYNPENVTINTSVFDLDLSVIQCNNLQRHNIKTVAQLMECTEDKLNVIFERYHTSAQKHVNKILETVKTLEPILRAKAEKNDADE